ncbi:uncharacterized protein LOC143484711 isoform X2 [Brachyhypopomus gauderio]|uniref:uncharacterized protein LOC143484711 isoform X2 n=1 Tax=Brachyhypopomus gauderio TaxID=698409 RepID=UPI0040421418
MDLLENEEDLLRLAASSLSLRLRGRRKRFSVGAEYLACQLRASPEQLCAAAVIEDPGEQNVSPCRKGGVTTGFVFNEATIPSIKAREGGPRPLCPVNTTVCGGLE